MSKPATPEPALAQSASAPSVTLEQALAWHRSGELDRAAQAYRALLGHNPAHVEAMQLLAVIHDQQGQHAEACTLLHKVLALRPDYAEAWNNLGLAERAQNRFAEALQAFETACRYAPHYSEALWNWALLLIELARWQEAETRLLILQQLHPEHADVYFRRAQCASALGRDREALTLITEATARAPHSITAQEAAGKLALSACDMPVALRHLRQAVDAHLSAGAEYAPCFSTYITALHYDPTHTRQSHAAEAQRVMAPLNARQRLTLQPASPNATPNAAPNKKLHIGYVSGDFRAHPVGRLLLPVLRHHDRSRFTLTLYANQRDRDAVAEALAAQVDAFMPVMDMDDAALAARIQQDNVDILLDLSGHTEDNRLGVFALKPARLQASWLAYFNTTALQAMDYILCDKVVLPPAHTAEFTEQPLYLPHSYFVIPEPEHSPPINTLPALERGYITFGSANYLLKINRDVVALWARILHALPTARLRLQSPLLDQADVRAQTLAWFAEQGIHAERIDMVGRTDQHGVLAGYHAVDIALDPFPYGGGTTSGEALWMGVPVITWPSDRWAGRVSASLLTTLGMTECIAHTAEEYVAAALAMAEDIPRLAATRAHLRARLQSSPLMDAAHFTRTRTLEEILCDAYNRLS